MVKTATSCAASGAKSKRHKMKSQPSNGPFDSPGCCSHKSLPACTSEDARIKQATKSARGGDTYRSLIHRLICRYLTAHPPPREKVGRSIPSCRRRRRRLVRMRPAASSSTPTSIPWTSTRLTSDRPVLRRRPAAAVMMSPQIRRGRPIPKTSRTSRTMAAMSMPSPQQRPPPARRAPTATASHRSRRPWASLPRRCP